MNKLKPFFAAAKSADGNALELTVYEDIGADWFGDGITAKTVKQQIDDAGAINRISLRINSAGGDAFEGIAIYNLLRAQNKFIDVNVDGIAASAASIIAMAGDSITMGPNAMMMIHNAWMMCYGDARLLRQQADVLDRVSEAIAQTYIHRTGKSADEVKALMDAESWLGAQECLDAGFCTAIAESDDGRALAVVAGSPRFGKLRNLPDKLKDNLKAAIEQTGIEPESVPDATGFSTDLSRYEATLELLKRR